MEERPKLAPISAPAAEVAASSINECEDAARVSPPETLETGDLDTKQKKSAKQKNSAPPQPPAARKSMEKTMSNANKKRPTPPPPLPRGKKKKKKKKATALKESAALPVDDAADEGIEEIEESVIPVVAEQGATSPAQTPIVQEEDEDVEEEEDVDEEEVVDEEEDKVEKEEGVDRNILARSADSLFRKHSQFAAEDGPGSSGSGTAFFLALLVEWAEKHLLGESPGARGELGSVLARALRNMR